MKEKDYADLEIVIRKRDASSYGLSVRYHGANDAADNYLAGEPVFILPPLPAGDDPEAYAAALTSAFFTPEIAREFVRVRSLALAQSAILRVRLTIDSSAPELHAVHWETLRDPDLPDAPLFMGEQIVVSRFLTNAGEDWRPIRLRAKGALKALVAIANPPALERFRLAPVDVPAELARAAQALKGIQVTALAPGGSLPLNTLAAELRKGCDILYLVCHGVLDESGVPRLFLEEGTPISGLDLVQQVRELDQRPLMVVLASCQSAGKGGVAQSGLGPRLAAAGVPAVIAMQGSVFMSTAAAFMSRFFTELLVDGQVDRAMSVARGDIRKTDDFWMPVLFLRLRNGRIWYEPGFAGGADKDLDNWNAICNSIRSDGFVPIVGPELGEDLFGGTQEWAASLGKKNGFPLGDQEITDLAKVTQFISVTQKRKFTCDAVVDEFRQQLGRRLESETPGASAKPPQELNQLAVDHCRADPCNPYRILSELSASVYLNASYDSLLFRVLKADAKDPEQLFTKWRGADVIPQRPQPISATPTRQAPWVYHIFGVLGREDTLVLTEDDFFDYLISTSRDKLLLPALVGKLMQSSLLFLGFRLDDWRFRVLFRLIVTQPGARTMMGLSHVGVQINPGEQTVADVNRAKDYLQKYFSSKDAPDISIYWGSPTDFLQQLKSQLAKTAPATPALLTQGGDDEYP